MTELENAIWAVVEQLEIMNISKKKSVSKNEHTEEVKALIEAGKRADYEFRVHGFDRDSRQPQFEAYKGLNEALKAFEKEEANDRPD